MYNCDDKNQIYPLHVSNEEKSDHFDLFFVTNVSSHYCFINNF